METTVVTYERNPQVWKEKRVRTVDVIFERDAAVPPLSGQRRQRADDDAIAQQQQRMQQIGPVSQQEQKEYVYVSQDDPSIKITLLHQHQKGLSFQIWPSSIALADYAIKQNQQNPGIYQNIKVLELGSGCGLSGLVFSALGAHVMLTDLEKVLPMLNQTIQLNQLFIEQNQGTACAKSCQWGQTQIQELGDWSAPDLVIAADVVYHSELFNPLMQLLKQLPCGTVVIIAHIRRWKSDKKFFKQLNKYFIATDIQQNQDSNSKCRQQLLRCERNQK